MCIEESGASDLFYHFVKALFGELISKVPEVRGGLGAQAVFVGPIPGSFTKSAGQIQGLFHQRLTASLQGCHVLRQGSLVGILRGAKG
jgi:hypothetical protein